MNRRLRTDIPRPIAACVLAAPAPFEASIGALLRTRPRMVDVSGRVSAAVAIFKAQRLHDLPVVDRGRLVGILPLRATLLAERDDRIGDVMSCHYASVPPTLFVGHAISLLREQRLSYLPVVEEGRLCGVYTAADVLALLAARFAYDLDRGQATPTVAAILAGTRSAAVQPTTTVAAAWMLMCGSGLRELAVVSEGRPVGLVTEHDFLGSIGAAARRRMADDAVAVGDVMDANISSISATAPAAEAAETLLRRPACALPVVGSGGQLAGVLSATDFLDWLALFW